jgi:hypothetical protein
MKIKLAFATLFLILIPTLTFSQSEKKESLTVTTYFPSPEAVFSRMEVRSKLLVGNVSDSHISSITSINDLQQGQVFVTNSTILGSLTSDPGSAQPGQIFYNNTTTGVKRVEFYNGNWISLGE